MTSDDRVRALAPLGLSERQTRFLVTVALHGGFCLRRHYTTFAGLTYGAGVRDFLDRLVTRKLARRLDFRRDRGHVYHLHASAIYDAIGQPDNRNRRRTSAALIARKLMLFDYVLGQGDVEWYATEPDKVALFTDRFGLRATDLPQRVYPHPYRRTPPTIRYFIHKLPIFVAGDPPIVSLVFLVTDVNGQSFDQFLKDHVRLLNALPRWRIVAVAPRHVPGLPTCQAVFRQFTIGARRPPALEETDQLRIYFAMLDRLERNDLDRVSIEEIHAFQKLRPRFAAAEFETLFERWKAQGPSVFEDRGVPGFLAAVAEERGELITHQLPMRYDRFGTRAGVS